ncbi:hypothetical protein [Nonomuraea dietziae]|uniref:hypothetical protein n=1 Tax=Nonomuraea dietziae TaxID=65515 RepID=UPI0031D507C4
MVTHQGKLYLGVYPWARIYEWTGSEPKLLLNLAEHEQDRPFAMISAGDWLAFGTVPKAGTVGGALGLYDPATGRSVLRRNLIPGHSIIGLAYRDGVRLRHDLRLRRHQHPAGRRGPSPSPTTSPPTR